jgi:hypothetical protein
MPIEVSGHAQADRSTGRRRANYGKATGHDLEVVVAQLVQTGRVRFSLSLDFLVGRHPGHVILVGVNDSLDRLVDGTRSKTMCPRVGSMT